MENEKKLVVYVAGPYRSDKGITGIFDNIMKAREITRKLFMWGYIPICPHLNTMLMDGTDVPDQFWLDADMLILERCDGIVMLPRFTESSGAMEELKYARELGLRVFYIDEEETCVYEVT